MTAAVADPRRLDPFQLPTATTARFVLLMLLTLAGSAYTYDWYFAGPTGWNARYNRCDAVANVQAGILAPNTVTGSFLGCGVSTDHGRFGVDAAAVALVALVIVATHALSGRVLIWWRGLVPPPKELYPESVAEVRKMVAEAGLRRAPTLLIDPHRNVRCGRVFGCFGRYYLRLNLSVLRRSDDTSTEDSSALLRGAIVRHELAHLRNRDVDVTGLTIAAGRVFTVLVAAPLVVLGITRHSPYFGQMWWRLAVVLLLVIVVRAAVIRSREHYADVAASGSGIAGEEPGFLAAFPDPEPPEPRHGQVARLVRPLAALVRMHPSSQQRISVINDPGTLLTVGTLEALAIGLSMGLPISYLFLASNLLFGGNLYSAPVAAFLLSLPAIGALVAGLWRATLRALATRVALPTGTAAGVGVWAGLLLGQILTRPFGARWPLAFVTDPVFGVIDALGLLVGCLLFTRWSVGAAAAWLPAARGRSLRPALASCQLIGALAFSGAFAVWLTVPLLGPRARYDAPLALLIALAGPYALVPILLATAFPLGAALRRSALPAQRALWRGTSDVAALPAPRLRIAAVLIPPLAALGTAVMVELLVRGGVLHLAQTVAATHGLGNLDSSFVVLAMEIAPTIVIVPLVLAMTSGPASAGLGPAHAVLAAALSSFLTVFVISEYTTGVACGAPCGGFAGGWKFLVSSLASAEGATLCLALVLLAVIYLIRGSLHRLRRGPRRQWPAGQTATDQPARGPAWPLRWAFVLLILALSLTVSYEQALQNLLPATMQPPTIAVIVPPRPTPDPVPTAVVCSRNATLYTNITSADQVLTRQAQLAGAATAADSPALSAFGTSLTEGLRTQNQNRLATRALFAIQRYCFDITPQPPQI